MAENNKTPDYEIISILKGCNAVIFGDFTLSSGQKSSYYVNIKKASTDPVALKRIAEKIAEIIKSEKKGKIRIGGVELGGVPIATAVSLQSKKPLLVIRKSEKSYGTKGLYVGDFEPGDEIVMIEDVTTSGGSVKKAIEQVREDGGIVKTAITIVDRSSGAIEALKEIDVDLIPLVTAEELLNDEIDTDVDE